MRLISGSIVIESSSKDKLKQDLTPFVLYFSVDLLLQRTVDCNQRLQVLCRYFLIGEVKREVGARCCGLIRKDAIPTLPPQR
jgi:hypothetical protein